jgi:hypothetical protein
VFTGHPFASVSTDSADRSNNIPDITRKVSRWPLRESNASEDGKNILSNNRKLTLSNQK